MRWLTSILLLLICPAWAADYRDITGLWRGQVDGLPALAITISDEGGEFTGAILFYMIRREDGQPPRSTPGTPEPTNDWRHPNDARPRQKISI